MIAQLDLTAFSVLGIPIALAVIGFFGWMIWRFLFNDYPDIFSALRVGERLTQVRESCDGSLSGSVRTGQE